MATSNLSNAGKALAGCRAVVDRLHRMCCEPDRSPRMNAIADALAATADDIDAGDPSSLRRALYRLDTIGESVGHLQVGCCTVTRMPLYSETLTLLNGIQLDITSQLGLTH